MDQSQPNGLIRPKRTKMHQCGPNELKWIEFEQMEEINRSGSKCTEVDCMNRNRPKWTEWNK